MGYQALKISIGNLLKSHQQIKSVQFNTPSEWIKRNGQPEYGLACYALNSGRWQSGMRVYNLTLWFLDLSGREGEFSLEVENDQLEIANDIVALIRNPENYDYWMEGDTANFTIIQEQFEDFLSGCEVTMEIGVSEAFDRCQVPRGDFNTDFNSDFSGGIN